MGCPWFTPAVGSVKCCRTPSRKVSTRSRRKEDRADRLKGELLPPFDECFSPFLEDLESRGLLKTTLVVYLGVWANAPDGPVHRQGRQSNRAGPLAALLRAARGRRSRRRRSVIG